MKMSYFETGRYVLPPDVPHEWPVPPDCYDLEMGTAGLRGMVERVPSSSKWASTGSACRSITTRRAS